MTAPLAPGVTTTPKTRARGAGRPAQSDAEVAARKEQLVAAAYEVFADKGYHDAGIADIAAVLGLGHGTFYRYFENKRDILDHVIDFAVRRVLSSLTVEDVAHVDTAAEFRVQLTRFGDALFSQVVNDDPRLLKMLVLEAAAIDEELLQRVLGLIESTVATFTTVLAEAAERGFIRPSLDRESAARALVGCASAAVLAELRGAGMTADARRRYVDTVVSLICDNVDPGTAR
jgi:AcrR family transcriptional regulator